MLELSQSGLAGVGTGSVRSSWCWNWVSQVQLVLELGQSGLAGVGTWSVRSSWCWNLVNQV